MPTELLQLTPAYVIVGAYRLLHDEKLWRPIWAKCRSAALRGIVIAMVVCAFTYAPTRLYVRYFLRKATLSAYDDESRVLGVSVFQYATLSFLAGQASMVLEFVLSRQLKKARADVYEATVQSRGKAPDFFGPYVEEWLVPPIERAKRAAIKQSWYSRLASPLFRMLLLKVLLAPLAFVPFVGLIVSAGIRAVVMSRTLHEPLFVAKRLTAFERELWMTERLTEYRVFGFTAALVERLPLIGIIFSVSNRIGAAMYAFDLEKRQHAIRDGLVPRTQVYQSRTAALHEKQAADPVPQDEGSGAFPTVKAPLEPVSRSAIRQAAAGESVQMSGSEGGGLTQRRVPPPLPKRAR